MENVNTAMQMQFKYLGFDVGFKKKKFTQRWSWVPKKNGSISNYRNNFVAFPL